LFVPQGIEVREQRMTTRHVGIVAGGNGLPRISKAVVHDGLVYLCGVTADPLGDIVTQTRQVLARINALLAPAGTDKSRLLTAHVWLSDMAPFAEHNEAWNECAEQAAADGHWVSRGRHVSSTHPFAAVGIG